MIGDSMVPSIGSIRKLINAAGALTDFEQTAFRVPVRMAHESTVCLDSFSASQTTSNDQFRKSPRKAEASSFSSPAKNNQNRPTAFALNIGGQFPAAGVSALFECEKTVYGICLNNLQLLPFQFFSRNGGGNFCRSSSWAVCCLECCRPDRFA
jgi:hypothetical protein